MLKSVRSKSKKTGSTGSGALKRAEPYLWLLPTFLIFCIFTFYPFFETIFKSFFIVDSFGNINKFVGLENYLYIFADKQFLRSILNTLFFTVLTVPISKILGLLLALLANKRRKASAFYEAGFALPIAVSSSVAAMIFQLLYTPSLGIINGTFGLNVQWLDDPQIAIISIAVIQIWLSTSYCFLFLLPSVRSIPQELLESAKLDGATLHKQIIHIYLPLTSPIMFYLICTDAIYSFMMMSFVNILTDGGPQDSTITMLQYVYKQFAATGNYTNANPAAIIVFFLTFIMTLINFFGEKKGVHYA